MRLFDRRAARVFAAIMVSLALLGLAGCKNSNPEEATEPSTEVEVAAFPVTITDDAGREVTIESEPEKIVSLAPANTEIVYALGLLDRLVGVTSYDDYPAEVADIAKVGDFVGPNLEAVAAADPDLVLATTGVQADVIGQLEEAGAVVIAIDPQTMGQLFTAIETVGKATGTSDTAAEVVEGMQAEIERIEGVIEGREPVAAFVEIAQEPLFTVGSGTLIDELISLAGGKNVVSEPGYVGYSVEQLLADDPAVYMATLGSMSDPSQLESRPGYSGLSAVKAGRVFTLTDNLVSRPGPRIVEGLEEIARALHPDADWSE